MTHAAAQTNNDSAVIQEFRDYVYGVSHDIGAPVRAMVEFSRLLTDEHSKELNDEGRLYLLLIIENGKKLQDMMEGLLVYSRLNTEARPFATVDCMKALEDSKIALDDIIEKTGADIECDPLPMIEGDATQIWQLFTALLDNTLKFQPEGNTPRIKIKAERKGDLWTFSFADNGIGINERYHKKIFQVFQRLHPAEDYPGIGMGLALTRKIVHRHGGEIWVESAAGKGATFLFTMPARGNKV